MKISLKAARVNAKLTQAQAADKLHINKATLSSYENGQSFPPMDLASEMAALYSLSIGDFSFYKAVPLKAVKED